MSEPKHDAPRQRSVYTSFRITPLRAFLALLVGIAAGVIAIIL